MARIFLYGTLTRGSANHDVLVRLGARFVAPAVTRDARTLVDLGPYPALLPRGHGPEPCVVAGELFDLDDDRLPELDAFEGCPDLYRRETIALVCDGAVVEVFVYVFARRVPARARVLSTGRYASRGAVLPDGATPEQIDDD